MSQKSIFALIVLAVTLNVALACSPNIQAFQLANRNRPCTQCKEIFTSNNCSSEVHDPIFNCTQPTVTYTVSMSTSPCARATIVCQGLEGSEQSTAIVAQLESNTTTEAFGVISSLQSPNAHLILKCDSESQWIYTDLEGNVLAQPLTIQCAHALPDKVIVKKEQ